MPNLGLVCITASKEIRYRTVTRTRLHAQSPDSQRSILEDIFRDNLQTFDAGLRYCLDAGIKLYRLPSSIFPFADAPEGLAVLQTLAPMLARSGRRATPTTTSSTKSWKGHAQPGPSPGTSWCTSRTGEAPSTTASMRT